MTALASQARVGPRALPAPRISLPASLRLGIGGVALAGVLAGHGMTYALVTLGSPSELLAASGHGYLDAAVRVGLAGSLVAVLAAFAGHLRAALEGPSGYGAAAADLFARLLRAQVGLFLLQELGERWIAEAPLSGVLERGLLAIGLVSQLVLAALGAWFLRWILSAADRIGRALRTSPHHPRRQRAHPRLAGRSAGAPAGALTAWSLRGPPRRPWTRASAR